MSSNDRSQGTDSGPQAPYVLQELIKDVPLSGDEEEDTAEGAFITCVEFWSQSMSLHQALRILLRWFHATWLDNTNNGQVTTCISAPPQVPFSIMSHCQDPTNHPPAQL